MGERHVQNKYSPLFPLVCHQFSFANTFTRQFIDVVNQHFFNHIFPSKCLCRMSLTSPSERVTRPYHDTFRRFTIVSKSV